MTFVGVDLHKQTTTMHVVDPARPRRIQRRFSNADPAAMAAFLRSVSPCEVTVEATASYEWFVRLAEPIAARVVLAHPGKLRVIAESTRKSDKLDARVLAEMLARGEIPAAYRPTPRQREHRLLVRHRQFLRRRITGVRTKIRRLLSDHNLDRPDLFTKVGQAWLAEQEFPSAERFCLDQLGRQWRGYVLQLREAEARLREFAAAGSAQEQEDRALLSTVCGVGIVATDVILAELADWRRFSSAKKAVSYAGLVPGQRESAGKRKSLHIEKAGSPLLRWVLVQSAWQLVRRSPRWSSVFSRLEQRLGRKKAVVAVARRLLGVCLSVLRTRQPYVERELAAALDVAK